MTLHYHVGDYKKGQNNPLNQSPANITSLYNGNIAAWSMRNNQFDPSAQQTFKYRYDALNRLKESSLLASGNSFKSAYSYDQGGNLLSLIRNDGTGNEIDNLSYTYELNKNRLTTVEDGSTLEGGMPNGISNYQYDADGRLTDDPREGITDIKWSLDNKISRYTKANTNYHYFYDAQGQRIMKQLPSSTEYIIRDAGGNELLRLSDNTDEAEAVLYGSSRIGTKTLTATTPNKETRHSAHTRYELTDHLGNVRSTFSDRKTFTPGTEPGTYTLSAHTLSATDYYPFGMQMPGRVFNGSDYRYGFGGHEKVDEVSGSGNTIDMGDRWLDVRLGRTPKQDAKGFLYPSVSPYSYGNNNPILFIDPDGKVIIVATKDGQAQTLGILSKAFGEKARGFAFNEKNELTFTGNPDEFKGREAEVFGGLQTVMTSKTITNIVYEKNGNTEKHGGEATSTVGDNPSLKENTITIDPVNIYERKTGENYQIEYEGKFGGKTTNPDFAKTDASGNPVLTGTYQKIDVISRDSKAARFFHGIGHVLFQKNSEQEKVIGFENKARSIFKREKDNGKFKAAPEESRPVDDSHKNRAD